MKTKDCAKMLGITTAHMRFVLRGERNLSLKVARVARELLGGTLEIWLDPEHANMRRQLIGAEVYAAPGRPKATEKRA